MAQGFRDGPVKFTVHNPLEIARAADPGNALKLAYLEQDDENPTFRRILLDALARSETFRQKVFFSTSTTAGARDGKSSD